MALRASKFVNCWSRVTERQKDGKMEGQRGRTKNIAFIREEETDSRSRLH